MEVIEFKKYNELPYGANSHQPAFIGLLKNNLEYDILSRNKNLSYLDFLNLSECIQVLAEFFDVCAVAIVNETHICSVALGTTSENAYIKAVDCDPMAICGGCAGFSKEISLNTAKQLQAAKIKNILAPAYSKEAFSFLLETDINIIKINTPLHEIVGFNEKDIKITPFGALIQDQNKSLLKKDSFTVVSQKKPTSEQIEDAVFAWKIAKHTKSKCAIITKDLTTKAIVQSQTNSITAIENAVDFACDNSKDAVLAVDCAIENSQAINAVIQGRIGMIIESGDSQNSQNILKIADKYDIAVVFTKIRNNKY